MTSIFRRILAVLSPTLGSNASLSTSSSTRLTVAQRRYWSAIARTDILMLENRRLGPSFSGIQGADETATWLQSEGCIGELRDFCLAFKAIAESTLAGTEDPEWAVTVVSGYTDDFLRSITARFQATGPRRIA